MIEAFEREFRFLSNFWPCDVEFEGIVFPSTEHAFQAAKTLDKEERLQFLGLTPGQAKRLGRKVKMREDWETVKISVMFELLRKKFAVEPLRSQLLATGDEFLQEGNTWGDKFWGVDIKTGEGSNHLGNLLCLVRTELKGVVS